MQCHFKSLQTRSACSDHSYVLLQASQLGLALTWMLFQK